MKNNDVEKIVQRIREEAKRQGTSGTAIALRAGLSSTAIADMGRGGAQGPTLYKLKAIADALNVTVNWLLTGHDLGLTDVPIKGRVAAGPWIEMLDDPEPDTIPYPTRARHAFALRVVGDSMDQVAPEGSFIVVDPDQVEAQRLHGHLVVAKQYDTCTFKRLDLTHGLLLPFSSRWQDHIPLNGDVIITGKVIGIIKDMD